MEHPKSLEVMDVVRNWNRDESVSKNPEQKIWREQDLSGPLDVGESIYMFWLSPSLQLVNGPKETKFTKSRP